MRASDGLGDEGKDFPRKLQQQCGRTWGVSRCTHGRQECRRIIRGPPRASIYFRCHGGDPEAYTGCLGFSTSALEGFPQ
jgi:hypothetical protein